MDDIDNADYEGLLNIKKELKEKIYLLNIQLEHTQQIIDNTYECTCSVCEQTLWHHNGIPEDWGYVKDSTYLLCDKCHDRWSRRFGEIKLERSI